MGIARPAFRNYQCEMGHCNVIYMYKIIAFVFCFSIPSFVLAQQSGGIRGLIVSFGNIVSLLIPLSAACALLFFFWGLAKSILKSDNVEGRENGREIMKWGIVALFVIVSIWGIVGFIQSDLGIPDVHTISTPGIR